MFILPQNDIYRWDKYTIESFSISSLELMAQAAKAFFNWFSEKNFSKEREVHILCGNGNNGGDGLAIAILMRNAFYNVNVYHCQNGNRSDDNEAMLLKLSKIKEVKQCKLTGIQDFPKIDKQSIVIDALFGIGINRPLEGLISQLIQYVNESEATKIAVDTPSGLRFDNDSKGHIFKADFTVSFQSPKLCHLLPENSKYVGDLQIINIGLSDQFKPEKASTFYLQEEDIIDILKPRKKFDHKGTFGHALLITGSYGMIGASILSALSCLRSGCGKLTLILPECGYEILQTSLPEAMIIPNGSTCIQSINTSGKYKAIGIGCGIGKDPDTVQALKNYLNENSDSNLVLDADALNIIADEKLLHKVPSNSILTPHIKEFERLFGISANSFERLDIARSASIKHGLYIILKGAYTCITTPDGIQYFNSTGNPGMATAGTGDVLTGILTGIFSQGYSVQDSCLLGVYLHGLAGDFALKKYGENALIASDIATHLPHAFKSLIQ